MEDTQTTPLVSLSVNASGVEITVRYVVDYRKRRSTKTLLFNEILDAIEATNGEVKFATTTIKIIE